MSTRKTPEQPSFCDYKLYTWLVSMAFMPHYLAIDPVEIQTRWYLTSVAGLDHP